MNKTMNSAILLWSSLAMLLLSKNEIMLTQTLILNSKNLLLSLMSMSILLIINKISMKSYISQKMEKYEEMNIYCLMCILSILVFCSNKIIEFFVMFEITVIPMIVILITYSKEKEKIKALMFMVVTNMVFSMPFLIYSIYSLNHIKSMNYQSMLMMNLEHLNKLLLMFMALMLLTKYPLFLLHVWLPKAHVEASTPGSMILAGILLKLGTMGMEKNLTLMEKNIMKYFSIIKSIAMYSLIVTSLMAARCSDLKKMAAISSISHMAMVLMNTSLMSENSMEQAKAMMISHGFISSIMFMTIGKMYENKKDRSIMTNKNLESSEKSISMMWFLVLMMNVGIPPLMNVISEMMMFSIIKENNPMNILPLSSYIVAYSSISMIFITKGLSMKTTKVMNNTKNNTIMEISSLTLSLTLITSMNTSF